MKMVILGNRGGTNVGESFLSAAANGGIDARFVEARSAMEAPAWKRHFFWRILGRRPVRLSEFSRTFEALCEEERPSVVLTTGIAPLDRAAVESVGARCLTLNYLTDDPWNPAHRAAWFLDALPAYRRVFSPRRTNLDDLRRLGCSNVDYLPFAYDPSFFYPEAAPAAVRTRYEADVFFAGGADAGRAALLGAVAAAGFSLALYGDYWERFTATAGLGRGYADAVTIRRAASASRVCLGLVRRDNRDGHSMRSFEVPACGGCLLAEDTLEHREILGDEGDCALYFKTEEQMIVKLRSLLSDAPLRSRLSSAGLGRISRPGNTYAARLKTMVSG